MRRAGAGKTSEVRCRRVEWAVRCGDGSVASKVVGSEGSAK